MQQLGSGRQEDCREIQRNVERRHLKSAPSDPDGQRKIRGETDSTRWLLEVLPESGLRFVVVTREGSKRNRADRPSRRRVSLNSCASAKDRSCPHPRENRSSEPNRSVRSPTRSVSKSLLH